MVTRLGEGDLVTAALIISSKDIHTPIQVPYDVLIGLISYALAPPAVSFTKYRDEAVNRAELCITLAANAIIKEAEASA